MLEGAPDPDALMVSVATMASQLMGRGNSLLISRTGTGEFRTPFQAPSAGNSNLRDWDLKALCAPDLSGKLANGESVTINANHGSVAGGNLPYLILFPMLIRPEFVVLLGISVFSRREKPNHRQLSLLHLLCCEASRRIEGMLGSSPVNGPARSDVAPRQAPVFLHTPSAREELARFEDQIRARMLSNFAHELRTPLVAIRGYTKMILEGRAGPVSNTQREYLKIIADNSDKLVARTHNLSLLNGTGQLHLEPFDLRGLWAECVQRCSKSVSEKSIRLVSQIPSYPVQVVGDREKLVEVMTQLWGCALRCTSPGGELVVDIAIGRNDDVLVRIHRTGAGISQDILNGILDDSNSPSPRAFDDPGYGLSEAHKITCLHGGSISVANNAGGGFTFVITLPLMKCRNGV
jgi:signal transduction histidine kinase